VPPAALPVLVMVSAYSRWLTAMLIPSRCAEDLFAGWWRLLQQLGAVPRMLVWDGEAAIGRRRAGKTVLTESAQGFRGVLGTQIYVCAPADPEAKGIVERANQYLETSFLPGRTFTGPGDFNAQLGEWTQLVNGRRRRALECAPTDRIGVDRAAMLALPPVAPVTGWRTSLRLPRDHYVRLDGNDYSVHPGAIGRRVEVVADLERVQAFCAGRRVGDHERSWARHQSFTDPPHAEAATMMRREYRALTAARALRRPGPPCMPRSTGLRHNQTRPDHPAPRSPTEAADSGTPGRPAAGTCPEKPTRETKITAARERSPKVDRWIRAD
jgi:transposase